MEATTTRNLADEQNENVLRQTYENEAGNHRVERVWVRDGDQVHFTDRRTGYNYVEERWEVRDTWTHIYQLAEGTELLVGDGSCWDGEGRNWREYAEDRHKKLLRLRFPADDI